MADILRRNGETITFYSYKGGVGRSMALINAACLLALKGKKVLIIDWDLEAPGLHSFFNGKIKPSNLGLVDFVLKISKSIASKKLEFDEEIKELVSKEIGKYILKALTLGKETKVKLDIIKAGKFDDEYSKRLAQINWLEIYQNSPPLFRSIAYYLESIYDFILIDSRTGLADTAGISTMLMPSKLVLVYVLNKQNLDGVEKVTRQAVDYRKNSMDERHLSIYPLPSRIEKSTNPSDQKTWRDFHQKRFEGIFKEIYRLDKCNLDNYIDKCQIPYVISYAYGENIPVLSERITDANSISFDYNNFLETLTSDFKPWEVLSDEEMQKKGIEHFNKGVDFFINKDFGNAKKEYIDALKYLPNNGDIINNLGNLIIHQNSNNIEELNEAIKFFKNSIQSNQNNMRPYLNWGFSLDKIGLLLNEKTYFLEALDKYEIASNKYHLALDKDEDLNKSYGNLLSNWALTLMSLAKLSTGKQKDQFLSEAEKKISDFQRLGFGARLYNVACYYAILGKRDEALELLNTSLNNNEIDVAYVKKDEDWKDFLNDPEFKAIIGQYS